MTAMPETRELAANGGRSRMVDRPAPDGAASRFLSSKLDTQFRLRSTRNAAGFRGQGISSKTRNGENDNGHRTTDNGLRLSANRY